MIEMIYSIRDGLGSSKGVVVNIEVQLRREHKTDISVVLNLKL